MKRIFVDTAGWMSMADGSDRLHKDAVTVRDDWMREGGVLITTDYVVDEALTLVRMRLGIDAAERWWSQVSESPRVRMEWVHGERVSKALVWFFRWRDKSFSFTDCTSFVVMRELRIRKALTGDRHFADAGFEVLPRGSTT